MSMLGFLIAIVVVLIAGLLGRRVLDRRTDSSAWNRLIESETGDGQTYDPAMVADLPEPARRYFNYTIQRGTPLHTVVEIDMTGELGLGSKEDPRYQPMQAWQILAPPHGFVWKLKTATISGSDGATPEDSWTRFWLFGLVPVARVSGPDHQRSAFGRVVAEGAFWAPASLLPGEDVQWEALDDSSARAIVRFGDFVQAVDIVVDETGAPIRVMIQRWSNANPDQEFRSQPFGGELSEFGDFGGYRLPTHAEGGNHIGTPDYFAFYKADVTAIRFPAE
jgi:hypothetical protein